MRTYSIILLLLLSICLYSCIKSSYKVLTLSQRAGSITLYRNSFADVGYSIHGSGLKSTTKINLTLENMPEGMKYEIIDKKYETDDDSFDYTIRFSAGSAKGGQYTLRVIASEEGGGRSEQILYVTLSLFSRNDLIKMKRVFDTVYAANGQPDMWNEYTVIVTPDLTNEPLGVVFSKLCTVIDMPQFSTFNPVFAEIDSLSGRVTLVPNDMATRVLASGDGFVKGNAGEQYVELNYVTSNPTNNTHRNGKIILKP